MLSSAKEHRHAIPTDRRAHDDAPPVWLRPACAADAQHGAARRTPRHHAEPQDPETIASIIAESEASLPVWRMPPAPAEAVSRKGTYTLVAIQGERLLGTASLLSHHGTPQIHTTTCVIEQAFHSKRFNTNAACICSASNATTSPGPNWAASSSTLKRGQGLGKLLVAARLLLVAMHGAHFCSASPSCSPQREDGSNAFWDALGGPLTG